jgi:hypothetical protein
MQSPTENPNGTGIGGGFRASWACAVVGEHGNDPTWKSCSLRGKEETENDR